MKLREADIEELMAYFKHYRKTLSTSQSCVKVAERMNLDVQTVYNIQRRMRPTTQVAQDYIKGNALKLAMRVVRKANVDQAIGILSRPNIGVLDSPNQESGTGRHFMIGVAMDSLGSVKVGVQIGQAIQEPVAIAQEEQNEDFISPEPLPIGPAPNSVVNYTSGEEADLGLDLEDEEPEPKRVWHQRDPPKPKIQPIPLEVANPQGHIGQSLNYRLAKAKLERKEEMKRKKRERRAVAVRAKELREQLKKARGG